MDSYTLESDISALLLTVDRGRTDCTGGVGAAGEVWGVEVHKVDLVGDVGGVGRVGGQKREVGSP